MAKGLTKLPRRNEFILIVLVHPIQQTNQKTKKQATKIQRYSYNTMTLTKQLDGKTLVCSPSQFIP